MTQTAAAAPEVKEPKAPKIEQNGVARPGAGTTTERIWVIADEISTSAGAAAKRADVLAKAESEGINITTAATQFGRWCKFHGIKAAPKAPVDDAEPKAPKAPKAKKAKAEAAPAEEVAAE